MPQKLDLEKFKKLWVEGKKVDEIAREVGIPSYMQSYVAVALGLEPKSNSPTYDIVRRNLERIKRLIEKGYTARVIASMLGIPPYAVIAVAKAYNLRLSRGAKLSTKIAKLYMKGYTLEEIAEKLGVSVDDVWEVIRVIENPVSLVTEERLKPVHILSTILALVHEKGVVSLRSELEKLGLTKKDVEPVVYRVMLYDARVLDLSRKRGTNVHKYKPECRGDVYFFLPDYSEKLEKECKS